MDHAITDTPAETILHGALELSKNSWLLALQFPDRAQPSLYPIRGGDTVGLMAKLTAWSQGDRHVWSVVRVPNVDEEDLRRSHRERDRLVRERTAHINRIKGLLFGQGIRGINVKSKYKTLQIDKLVTGDGRPLPPRLANEITREIARLALIQEQIATLERERDQAPTSCKATEKKRLQLMSLNGIGPAIAAVTTREVYYRQFENRRQVAGFLGLATSPHDSGDVERSQGISRARARPRARDHDPGSLALAQAPAKECNHPLVCAANRRAERPYPTDHDHCGCA